MIRRLAAQNSHARGQPRELWTVTRLYGRPVEEVEPRGGVEAGLEDPVARARVTAREPAPLGVGQEARPGALGAAHDHGVGVLERLVRQERDVEPAQHDRHALRPEAPGERVRGLDPRGEARDAHQIEVRQGAEALEVVDLEVGDLVARRREPGDGQEPETRQRGDDPPAADEARERDPERRELRRAHADAAHRDQPDPHGSASSREPAARAGRPAARSQTAAISAVTGTGSR